MDWDVFISHASEDKTAVAEPLAEALAALGLKVWYDDFVLKVGDSLTGEINKGLARSRYGVVVFSQAFFAKHWPTAELGALAQREVAGKRVILPVWYDIDRDELLSRAPLWADRFAARWDQGVDTVVARLCGAMSREAVAAPSAISSFIGLADLTGFKEIDLVSEVEDNANCGIVPWQSKAGIESGYTVRCSPWFESESRAIRLNEAVAEYGYPVMAERALQTHEDDRIACWFDVEARRVEAAGGTAELTEEREDEQLGGFRHRVRMARFITSAPVEYRILMLVVGSRLAVIRLRAQELNYDWSRTRSITDIMIARLNATAT